jgi:translation initiation factor 2 gamma subunit (eIF-2gamma)
MLFSSFRGIINGSLEQVQGQVEDLIDLLPGVEIKLNESNNKNVREIHG